jgi:hypothetical protein
MDRDHARFKCNKLLHKKIENFFSNQDMIIHTPIESPDCVYKKNVVLIIILIGF